MIVTNFTSKPIHIKGVVLQVGANIVADDLFTEADRSKEIGIGASDLQHYNDVQAFFNSQFFTRDPKITRLNDMIKDIEANKELLKAQSIAKQASVVVNINVNKNIITTSRGIKAQQARVIKLIDMLKLEPLQDSDLVVLESLYQNITDDINQNFTITEYAKQAYAEIKETRKQALPYNLARIRAEYAR